MFDIKRRKSFSTVAELTRLLENAPEDAIITIGGDTCCYFHIEKDESVICLDTDPLEDSYEDFSFERVYIVTYLDDYGLHEHARIYACSEDGARETFYQMLGDRYHIVSIEKEY